MEIRLRRLGVLILAGLLISLAAIGCGSDSEANGPDESATAATPTVSPTATPPRLAFLTPGAVSPTKAPATTPTEVPATGSDSSMDGEDPMGGGLFELGEKIFTVGSDKRDQIGCQYCHAADGKGNIGPNIRGKMTGDIAFALDNVEAMLFLRLNQTDIEGVAEYLQWLANQP